MKDSGRVVVTGLGVVSSVGIGREDFWDSICRGKSGISQIRSFDTSNLKCHRGGEVKNFKAGDFIDRRKVKYLGKTSQFALSASILAFEDAGLKKKQIQGENTGVFIGTTMGGKPMEDLLFTWVREKQNTIDKIRLSQVLANNISNNIGIYFGINGMNYLFPTACAAGNYAIGYGYDMIRTGKLERAVTGGADAFFYIGFIGFQSLYAMAPQKCQPFDKNRKGMMLGEGAGILILERLDVAKKRNARIYAEIKGYGLSCDAYHPTAPEIFGVTKTMENALEYSGISYKDIDYISAHGTGTLINDKIECRAIKNILKERYKKVPVSSLKSMLGHPMGAASALEAIACCLTVKHGIIPPTINYKTPDPECDIDCVPNHPRRQPVKIALNNGFGFGGNNSSLVIGRFDN